MKNIFKNIYVQLFCLMVCAIIIEIAGLTFIDFVVKHHEINTKQYHIEQPIYQYKMPELKIPISFIDSFESNPKSKIHAHIRYWLYIAEFTLTTGCKSSAKCTVDTYENYSLNFDDMKRLTQKWVYPKKIKTFIVTRLKQISKSEMLLHSEKFSCEKDSLNIIPYVK